MPPPLPIYPLSTLESRLNVLPNGKARKPPVKLDDCALKELVQHKCNIHLLDGKSKTPQIICEPVARLLRVCAGGLTVETTAWEGWKAGQKNAS
ncbi:mitochondrial export protein Som1 [Phaeosphaeria sp. MPI-PUGE-AT-0046c]|nr:mitochondrial export protein Som1 [Phaeosphaeria sp. MPI-PUGE-AT-0046c]